MEAPLDKKARPRPGSLILILVIAVLSTSVGSILVRFSQEAPSLSIAFYRVLWACLLLAPFYLLSSSPRPALINKGLLIAGSALALHFAFWIASLRYTSVAVSVLLVSTSPALVAVYSHFFLRERLTLRGIVGLSLALLGSLVLVWNDLSRLDDWRGALLALLGAVMVGVYIVAGRTIRQTMSLIHYVYPTYLIAAAVLGVLVLLSGSSLAGFSSRTYLFLFLLGLVPQSLGHTAYNWALEHLSATTISTLTLGEPVLATILAWWLLGEEVGPIIIVGAILVGAGIYLVSRWGIETALDRSSTSTS
ncbi:MAG TPA: DMT family transporter [Acidobacteriota bacterium]|nr:DMT family transporter [Acidobacteriota bacterium]